MVPVLARATRWMSTSLATAATPRAGRNLAEMCCNVTTAMYIKGGTRERFGMVPTNIGQPGHYEQFVDVRLYRSHGDPGRVPYEIYESSCSVSTVDPQMNPHLWNRLRFGVFVLMAAGTSVAALGVALAWSGLIDVGATSKHSRPVALLLHRAMEQSVAFHAPNLVVPNLQDETLIRRGATHFATGCAPCHGAPGVLASPIAQQMTPTPPGLYSAGRDYTANELFWIVKNGVKMTAMPAWPAQQRTDEIWAMVALLKHLPDYNTEAFAAISGWDGRAGFLSATSPSARLGSFNASDCARCHGADGEGRDGTSPKITGLSIKHFVELMRDYRDGSKPSGFMQPIAAALTDAQIEQAARVYSRLPASATASP